MLSFRFIKMGWIFFLPVFVYFIITKLKIGFHRQFALIDFLFILFLTGMLIYSWVMPVINYDSLTYHLPRIMHWLQNKSTMYYQTAIPRQLFNGFLAEYWMMHAYAITGRENAFSVIQWGAYSISTYLIFAICKKLRVEDKFAYLGAGLRLSAPIVFIESLTTQNDIVAAVFVLLGVNYTLEILKTKEKRTKDSIIDKNWIYLGICTAMGYMTKGTAPLALACFWLGTLAVRIVNKKDSILYLLKVLSVNAVIMLLFILPQSIDNYKLWKTPFALENFDNVLIGNYGLRYFVANLIKNWGLHASNTVSIVYETLEKLIINLVSLTGVQFTDENITFQTTVPYSLEASYNCDRAPVPLISFVIMICCLACVIVWKNILPIQRLYSIMTISAFAVTLGGIKSQPWITRLTIPVISIICIFITIMLSYSMHDKIGIFCYSVICLYMFFSIGSDVYRYGYYAKESLFGQYEISESTSEMRMTLCDLIEKNDYYKIGVILGSDTVEYPLWHSAMNDKIFVQIEHICLPEEYGFMEKLERCEQFIPDCIVIGQRDGYAGLDCFYYNSDVYRKVYASDDEMYFIFEKEGRIGT